MAATNTTSLNVLINLASQDPAAARQLLTQLQQIAQSAQQAGTLTQQQLAQINQLQQQLTQALTQSNQRLNQLGQSGSGLENLAGLFGDVKTQALALTGALGTVGGFVGIAKRLADEFSEYAESLRTVAAVGDLSNEAAAGLILAFQQIGSDANDASALISQFTTKLSEARSGEESARKGFEKLGITFDDLKKKKPEEILAKVAREISNLADQEARVAGADAIFGGDDAVKFTRIADSLADATAAAKTLGLALSNKEIEDARTYTEQVRNLEAQWKALAVTLGKEVAPALTNVGEAIDTVVNRPGDLFEAIGDSLQDYVGSIQNDLELAGELKDQFNAAIEGEAARTGSNFAATLLTLSPLITDVSEKLGVAQVETAVFTRANREALETISQNADLFKQAAQAQGISTEQVLRLTGGNLELTRALIENSGAQQQAIEESKARAAAAELEKQKIIELTAANTANGQSLKEAQEAQKQTQTATENRLKAIQMGADIARRAGASEVQIARETYGEIEALTQEQLESAQRVYDEKIRLAQSAYDLEVARAKGNKTIIAEAEKERLAAVQAAQNEYDTQALKTAEERNKALEVVEKASADARSKIREQEFADLNRNTQREIELVNRREEQGRISATAAAEERSRIRREELAQQEAIIRQQLDQEHVGIEERRRLEESLRALQGKLRDENQRAEFEALDATTKATEKAVAERTAALSKQQAFLGQAIALIETSDTTALEKAQMLAELKQRQIALEIQKVQVELDGARQNSAAKEKIIALETRLIELGGESIRVAGELGEAYRQAGQSAADAADRAKASSEANLGAILGFINGLVGQVSTATRENIDEMLNYLQTRVNEAVTGLANAGPQITGIFEFYAQKANEALTKLREKQAEFQREDARKLAEERRREAERQAQQEADIRERALDAQQDANDRLADAQSDYREGVISEDTRWLKERQKIVDGGNQALATIEAQRDAARIRREQKTTDRLLQIARDLEDSREQAALESSQRQADSEFDRVNREIELQTQLEAAKASGDPDKVAGIQSELDAIQADRNRDAQRAEEERLAREKAAGDEELAILLDGIEEKYRRQEAYEKAVAALGANASEAQRAQLEAAYQAQLAALEASQQAELSNLQEREEQARLAREREAAEEEAAFQKQIDDQKQRNIDLLTTAEQGHRDRLDALKQTLEDEKTAHAEAIANIRATLEAELAKMTEAWKKYASDTNTALGSMGGGSGGGTGGGPTAGVGGGSTSNIGGGGTTTTTSGTEPGGGATTEPGKPDRSNQEEKKRQISGYQDVLDAFEAGELAYGEANDQMNAILRAGGAATSGQYDTYYSFKNKLRALQGRLIQEALAKAKEEGKAADQVDISKLVGEGEFKTDAANAALAQQASAKQTAIDAITSREKEKVQKGIQADLDAAASDTGIPDSLRELIDQVQAGALDDVAAYQTLDQQRGSLSPEQFTTVSKALVAARKAYLLKTGQLEKQFADQAAALYAQGDRGQRDTGRGGQQGAGGLGATPGAPRTPGSPGTPTTTTPPPAGTTEPPKPVRNAKIAGDLLFAAQNATTPEAGQSVLKAATEALKAGTIDDDDRGKIRAALDSVAFQNNYLDGFDTSGLGQNATRPGVKPGTPGVPGIRSFQDAQSALSATSLVSPQPETLTAPGALSPVDIPPPAPPAVSVSIGSISGSNQDEIITTVFAKLETQMRSGLTDAGIPT